MKLNQWFSYVDGEVRNCLPSLMRQALLDAMQEFCTESQLWSREITVTPVADRSTYILTSGDSAQIVGITHAEQQGIPILGKSKEWLDPNIPSWRTETAPKAEWFYIPEPGQIRMVRTPNSTAADNDYTIDTFQAPSLTADTVPDWLFSEWRLILADGAKAFLMEQEDTPWGNRVRARALRAKFEMGISEGRIRKAQGRTLGKLEVQAVPFGGIMEI